MKIQNLLDKGHIRFFNKKSAENLIKDAGFEITKFDITGLDSPFGTKFFQLIGNQLYRIFWLINF